MRRFRVQPTIRGGKRVLGLDRDHYTLEWYTMGDDSKEEKTVSMTHTRRK